MTPAQRAAASRSWRAWPVWGAPRAVLGYFVAVEILALAWSGFSLAELEPRTSELVRFAALLLLALAFEEGARKAAALSFRLSDQVYRDMAGVWVVPAALAFPAGLTACFVAALYCYMYLRQYRATGAPLHRVLSSVAVVIIACLAANRVATAHLHTPHWSLAVAAWVLLGMLVHAVVNRGLVTVAWLLRGMRGRQLFGTWDENLAEYATLCLGGLVTVAVVFEPWLTPLVLVPMVSLQRAAVVRKLEQAATTDSKTGLLNPMGWEHHAQREIARAKREDTPLAVLIIDLDFFKQVNDTYGHLCGDEVLKGVGQIISSELRGYDVVGRFGGEEFVAMLPNIGEADAVATAERMRSRVNRARVSELLCAPALVPGDHLSVSIGVAVSPADGSELVDLLHAADAALYLAKASGRNQVRLARRGGEVDEPVTLG